MSHKRFRHNTSADDSDSDTISTPACSRRTAEDSGSDNEFPSPLQSRRTRDVTTVPSCSSSSSSSSVSSLVSLSSSTPAHGDNLISPSTSPLLSTSASKRLATQQFLSTLPPTLVEEVVNDYVGIYGYEPTHAVLVSVLQEKLMGLARNYRSNKKNRNRLFEDSSAVDGQDTGSNVFRADDSNSDVHLPSGKRKHTALPADDDGDDDDDGALCEDHDEDFSNEIEFLLGSVSVQEEEAPNYIS